MTRDKELPKIRNYWGENRLVWQLAQKYQTDLNQGEDAAAWAP